MKKLLILLLIGIIGYGGYVYYRQRQPAFDSLSSQPESASKLVMTQGKTNIENVAAVLGAQVEGAYNNAKEFVDTSTGGQADPIINRAVSSLQSQVKDLPKETLDKVKYEFCRGVVDDYETKKETL